jgi:hypothetical protein
MTARGAIVEKGLVGRKAIGDYLSNTGHKSCRSWLACDQLDAVCLTNRHRGQARSYKGYFFAAALTLR